MRLRRAASAYQRALDVVYFNSLDNFTLQFPMMLAPVIPEDTVESANRKFRIVGRYIDILLVRRAVNFMRSGYSTMSYNAFSTVLAIRGLPPRELAEGLVARLNGPKPVFDRNSGTPTGTASQISVATNLASGISFTCWRE